uniref:DUF148 domain-containing protein n=1 Tax=Rhabditophanes sp. KR3021 TaxID=114890 RepID=A0AC35UCY9_9BILA
MQFKYLIIATLLGLAVSKPLKFSSGLRVSRDTDAAEDIVNSVANLSFLEKASEATQTKFQEIDTNEDLSTDEKESKFDALFSTESEDVKKGYETVKTNIKAAVDKLFVEAKAAAEGLPAASKAVFDQFYAIVTDRTITMAEMKTKCEDLQKTITDPQIIADLKSIEEKLHFNLPAFAGDVTVEKRQAEIVQASVLPTTDPLVEGSGAEMFNAAVLPAIDSLLEGSGAEIFKAAVLPAFGSWLGDSVSSAVIQPLIYNSTNSDSVEGSGLNAGSLIKIARFDHIPEISLDENPEKLQLFRTFEGNNETLPALTKHTMAKIAVLPQFQPIQGQNNSNSL